MQPRSRLVLVGLLALASSGLGCPRATDPTPQIQVSKGAAERICLIPSRACGADPTRSAARSRVHPMAAGEALGGPNATGKPGDWVLENDEVVFVIDALGRGTGFAESGGNIVDAADAKVRKDELGQLFTYFGAFPRQAVYSAIDARVEPDGTAIVEARGPELHEPSVEVVTQYRLAGGDRALLLRTTLTNRGTAKVEGLGLGDAIQWGGAEKIAPGKSVGFKGPSKGPYIGGVGQLVSYAVTSTDGDIAAVSGGTWTDTEQRKNVALGPGDSVSYERVFVVGERPDVASVVAELTKASGGDVGAIEIALVDAKGAPVRAPPGAKVVLGTETAESVMTIVATREGDTFGGEVPPGTWLVGYAPSAGRRGDGKKVAVEVKKRTPARATLVVGDATSVALGPCEEPAPTGSIALPCKLAIEGQGGTSAPDLRSR